MRLLFKKIHGPHRKTERTTRVLGFTEAAGKMGSCKSSAPQAAVAITWAVAFVATIWRFAGPARQDSSNFVLGTGVTLLVFQAFAALLLCALRYIGNPPFFLCWCFISLVFINIAVHVAVLGSDVARVTLSPETVPFNLLEYDLASLICQCLFLTGIFSLSFNAGSHTSPPPWATHRGRHRSRGTELTRPQDIAYASAGNGGRDSPVHSIGLDSDGHTSA